MPNWLNDAVFYEIYPQSFQDTNGDGIGDLPGVTQRLDYVKSLGCNALWLNPCFDSPFKDAGYDVRDYKKVAPRYGTNADLIHLFDEAHKRGVRVLLDLVPGHTSEEHPWFLESGKAEKNDLSGRYVWTNHCFEGMPGYNYVAGEQPRNGAYLLNFFKCQPALNYGFYTVDAPWQQGMDAPDCVASREAMKDVMRFWLDAGCDGFRVDMAASLVKNDDEKKSGTSALWRDVRAMLDADYPEAALLSEWGKPEQALRAGFHMDFMLSGSECPGYRKLMRDYAVEDADRTFFKKDGHGDIRDFLEDYLPRYEDTRDKGLWCPITCNHDTIRPRYNMDETELKLCCATLFTLPGAPFLYYGDEIGMAYQNLPTKEGGYYRTGSRTPMQWDGTKNLGFSTGAPEDLYLPVDPSPDAPTVERQERDPNSLLNTVRAVLAFRHSRPELRADAPFELVYGEGQQFVYRRGGLLLGVNTAGAAATLPVAAQGTPVFAIGAGALERRSLTLEGQSFCVWEERP